VVVAATAAASFALAGCLALLDLPELTVVDSGTADGPGADANRDGGNGGGDGACGDLSSDPRNCGACGRACLGACVDGRCAPKLFYRPTHPLTGLATTASDVLWTTTQPDPGGGIALGELYRCDKRGCDVALTVLQPFLANPRALAISGTTAAWLQTSVTTIYPVACALPQCSSLLIFNADGADGTLAAGGDAIVWFDPTVSALRQARVEGGPDASPTFAAVGRVERLAISRDGARLAFAESSPDRIRACTRSGCTPVVLTSAGAVKALAFDGSDVVYVDSEGIAVVPATGATGPRRLIADKPDVVATEAGYVYYASKVERSVKRCPLSACATPTVVAESVDAIEHLAVDESRVYAASPAAIWVLSKP
jgi:hypothetical protein